MRLAPYTWPARMIDAFVVRMPAATFNRIGNSALTATRKITGPMPKPNHAFASGW